MEVKPGENGSEGGDGGPCKVRLFVRGLGPSVTSSDLQCTFSTLGSVCSIEFVRTKGRCFAFMTFEAASPTHLKRFFSLYNGCIWKGGRLKLEKAKEHYLEKLQREWTERELLIESSEKCVSKPDLVVATKHVMVPDDSKVLNIYFPKLRKVKKIPQKGSGRHKRSFERVEAVPCSLLQLCECSQSCKGSLVKENKLAALPKTQKDKKDSIVITEQMQDPINDELEEPLLNITGDTPSPKHRKVQSEFKASTQDKLDDSNKELEELHLNITSAPAHAKHTNNQSALKKEEDSKSPARAAVDSMNSPRKRVRFQLESSTSTRSKEEQGIGDVKDGSDRMEGVSNVTSVGRENLWMQKASWKSLVGETGRVSFSLGSILGQTFDSKAVSMVSSNNAALKAHGHLFSSSSESSQSEAKLAKVHAESDEKAFSSKNFFSNISFPEKLERENPAICQGSQEGARLGGDGTVGRFSKSKPGMEVDNADGKVCLFMRSENSEREWLESKRMVKEMAKRTRKDAIRSMKMFHSKRSH